MRRGGAGGALAAAILLATSAPGLATDRTTAPATPPARGEAAAPDLVLVLLDDLRWDQLRFMPVVRREIADRGITFRNAFVENPMCCPSRTSILTGLDSHTTGVFGNAPPDGGYETFHDTGGEDSTLATWLDDAGYRTGLVGKYLNDYGPGNLSVPPGWDHWAAIDERNGGYFDYDLNVDGTIVHHAHAAADYSTDVLAADARHFILDTPEDLPLFLYLAPFGPHAPAKPAPRDVGTAGRLPKPAPGVFERDLRDKPVYVRHRPPVDPRELAHVTRRILETLRAEDRAVRAIVHALDATDRLDDTVLVFASDNGFLLGEHRIVGKQAPYDESIRIPLVVRADAMSLAPGMRDQLVLNTDLAPTFAELAGVTPPPTDGLSLVPILGDEAAPGRGLFGFEHLNQASGTGDLTSLPSYCGIRTTRRSFVHYASGFEELYDVVRDPAQLHNLADDPSMLPVVERLRDLDRAYCSPRPPGMPAF